MEISGEIYLKYVAFSFCHFGSHYGDGPTQEGFCFYQCNIIVPVTAGAQSTTIQAV